MRQFNLNKYLKLRGFIARFMCIELVGVKDSTFDNDLKNYILETIKQLAKKQFED